jgi:hypothetical protein
MVQEVIRMAGTPKRLLRVLLAGGILATGWLAVDLVVNSEPAAAADILPIDSLAETVSTVVDPVIDPVAPVLTPVIQTVADIADPVVAQVASTIAPVTTPVVASINSGVIEPLAPVIQTVTEPLAPVAHALLDPLAPVVAPLLPVVGEVLGVQPVTQLLTAAVPGEALAVAGSAGLGAVTAASTGFVSLLGGELGSTPLQAPASPTAAFSAPLTGVAVLLFGVIAALGAAFSARPGARLRPLAPVFASDTTPD